MNLGKIRPKQSSDWRCLQQNDSINDNHRLPVIVSSNSSTWWRSAQSTKKESLCPLDINTRTCKRLPARWRIHLRRLLARAGHCDVGREYFPHERHHWPCHRHQRFSRYAEPAGIHHHLWLGKIRSITTPENTAAAPASGKIHGAIHKIRCDPEVDIQARRHDEIRIKQIAPSEIFRHQSSNVRIRENRPRVHLLDVPCRRFKQTAA